MQMVTGSSRILMNVLFSMITCLMLQFKGGFGIRFVIDKEECLSHNVPYEGDTVHVSFVVIKADSSWHYGDDGVDLVVKIHRFFFFFWGHFLGLFVLDWDF